MTRTRLRQLKRTSEAWPWFSTDRGASQNLPWSFWLFSSYFILESYFFHICLLHQELWTISIASSYSHTPPPRPPPITCSLAVSSSQLRLQNIRTQEFIYPFSKYLVSDRYGPGPGYYNGWRVSAHPERGWQYSNDQESMQLVRWWWTIASRKLSRVGGRVGSNWRLSMVLMTRWHVIRDCVE